ncbi:MAG: carbohydrate kinase family protein [Candidatus Methanomethylicus sp.]|nr:carbohydrate kinase family protein [Candidatus Methanomethylicus sp.]
MPQKVDVLAIGNLNIDLSFFLAKGPGPDSEIIADDFQMFQGGAASNFSVGSARLGIKTGLFACIGDDEMGKEAVGELKREGVLTSGIVSEKGQRTGTVCVLVEHSGTRRMIAFRGANKELAKHVFSNLTNFPTKVLQLCNINREVLKAALRNNQSEIISLDPGGASAELDVGDLQGLNIVLLNEQECRNLTGKDAEEGIKILSDHVAYVVVKQGSKGAIFSGNGRMYRMEPYRVKVADTTGAGDAFDAGFMAATIEGKDHETRLAWASATAALKIQKKGARSGLPTREELMAFLEERS